MILVPCVIQIDEKFYIDKKGFMTKDIKKAIVIHGRSKAKQMALVLQQNGIRKVKVIIYKNV